LFQRLDLARLYPPFLERVSEVVAKCRHVHGVDYWATRGFATYLEQRKLWTQGRTVEGAIVTWAKPGESAHNFGLAIDFAADSLPDVPKLQPSWRPESYAVLGEEARLAGLVWGGTFRRPDRPHVQWPAMVSAMQLFPVREAFEREGLRAAWDAVDRLSGAGKAVV
jgi:peptidoglycan L-alanyl-D-glutamate endopeptidase CwlK